tara:strand:+ start:372 stop:1238 length:867 start_codon:yes stop_codon:yes gene_type:complete
MARPKKNTVDYFPHDCHKIKELEILVDKYGNDGYAFYYRLFELLGKTPDHIYKFEKITDKMYLYKETGVDKDKANEIIKTLIELEIIDRNKWESNQNIWCQPFVDSIADVYEKRITDLPTKDSFRVGNPIEEEFPGNKPGLSGENPSFRSRNSQSKVKETKLNKTKREEGRNTTTNDIINLESFKKEFPTVDVDLSFERYRANKEESGKSTTHNGFTVWLKNDIAKGYNLKEVEPSEKMVKYMCPNDHGFVEAPQNKDPYKSCDECGEDYVKQYEYNQIKGRMKDEQR